jgi:16S rRNA (cytosine967-C5)-methyltransferase
VTTSIEGRRSSVRELASEILCNVETRKAYADLLLDHCFKSTALADRDRGLLTEIVYGTLRWRGKIDAELSRHLQRPIDTTEPFLRNLLRATFYQLLFLDKVPNYAAVNEAVEIAKKHGGKKISGFINGVLRNFLREKERPGRIEDNNDSPDLLAVEYSHPPWLVKEWLKDFGIAETKNLILANNQKAPLVLRVNTCRTDRETLLQMLSEQGATAAPTQWSPQGIWVQSGPSVEELAGFHEGFFQVQGEASQMVGYLLSPRSGDRVLDGCAAPGGKASHIAELIADRGAIAAVDISTRGIERIRENCGRLQLKSVHAHCADLSQPLPDSLRGPYDRILIDAPCSGLGTLRAHPEIKWQRDLRDIQRLSRLQRKILDQVAGSLKTGGILVYSTCTVTGEENEQLIGEFLSCHKELTLEDAAAVLPEQAKSMCQNGFFVALPHRHNTDGFFAARLRKVC